MSGGKEGEYKPQIGTAKEVQPVDIKRFTKEAREALLEQGYVIYALTGASIKSQRDAGRPFWSTWHKSLPDFEALPSMHSEVAINPDTLFIPDSNNKIPKDQHELIDKFSQGLAKKIAGTVAIMGEAPDYVELVFQHLDATGQRLFGIDYGYNYARTKTRTGGPGIAFVGNFRTDADRGLSISDWVAGYGDERVYAAPLVVPV